MAYIASKISMQVKRLFASGKLTSNGNELQKVCQELMVDENACKSFVEHQEFLAMKHKRELLKETLCQTLTGTMRTMSVR